MKRLALCLLLSGCATPSNNFFTAMQEFQTQPPHKAAAIIVENGRSSWGVAWGAPTEEAAKKRALTICNGEAARIGYAGECSLVKE